MNKKTYAEGLLEIMEIIGGAAMKSDTAKNEGSQGAGGAHVNTTINTINTINTIETINTTNTAETTNTVNTTNNSKPVKTPASVVYENGRAIEIDGKKTTTGYKKGAKRVKTAKDSVRENLTGVIAVILERTKAFEGKTGTNKVEGTVVRLADADYTIKATGHKVAEFADREPNFVATKNFLTRGSAENHSAAIAKALISEIEIQFSNSIFKNKNQFSVTLLSATSSVIRFEISNSETKEVNEFSYKITKKRSRVVFE